MGGPEIKGTFLAVPTIRSKVYLEVYDGFLSLRKRPNMASADIFEDTR